MQAELVAEKLNAPQSLTDSVLRFREQNKDRMMRNGRMLETLSVLFYRIGRNEGSLTKSFSEVVKLAGANTSTAFKYLTRLEMDVGLRAVHRKSEDYLTAYASRLRINDEKMQEAKKLLRSYEEKHPDGKTPMAKAGAALYLAAGSRKNGITQNRIAHVTDLAEYTVREASIQMRNVLARKARIKDYA